MPEGLEAEIWRSAISATIGRRITGAWVDERVVPSGFGDMVTGSRIVGVRRAGKVVVIDTDRVAVGLHFGMTGRIVVDGRSPIERLEYSSGRDDPGWDRLRLFTDTIDSDVPAVRLNDPRRFGRVSVDPDLEHLGPDIFDVTPTQLATVLSRRRSPIKSALLDQRVVAGLGNLCVDEVLFWAGIDPRRGADDVGRVHVGPLAAAIRRRMRIMLRRGGSTTGTLSPVVRRSLPSCPRDGGRLHRGLISGRTTVWCPEHQC